MMNHIFLKLVLVTLVLFVAKSEAQSTPAGDQKKAKLLDDFLKDGNFSDVQVSNVIESAVDAFINRDQRSALTRKPDIKNELISKIDKEKLAARYRAKWEPLFSSSDLEYLIKFRKSDTGKRIKTSLGEIRNQMEANIQKTLKANYKTVAGVDFVEKPVDQPAPEPGSIVKFIWKTFPETRTCPPAQQKKQ